MDLRTYLFEVNMKPAQFARILDVAPSTITRLIRKERQPGLPLALQIEKATNGAVTVEELVLREKDDVAA